MFSDSEFNITGFEPAPESGREVSDGNCQTNLIATVDKETQLKRTQVAVAQTAFDKGDFNAVPYDEYKLLTFLNKVMPHLEQELKDFNNSPKELGYQNANKRVGSEEFEQTYFKHILVEPECCKGKVISNLGWNSTGMLLAVAYCENNHEGWCNHDTSVLVYNTGKNKFEKNQPEFLLRAPGCVRTIKFHPYIPSLLAAGCHSGEIIVWSLINDEKLITVTKECDDEAAHVNAITALEWRQDRKREWLVTTGRDGRIVFWKITLTNLTYSASERFLVFKNQLLPTETQEILYISFWAHKENDFLIAVGNCVLHCCSKTAKSLPAGSKFKNPVSFSYLSHEGMVTSVCCLPGTDIFASCGFDGKIQIHKCKTITPLYVIYTSETLMGVRWMNNIKYLISWGSNSKAECHKISLDEKFHITKTFCEIKDKISIFEINYTRIGKFAIGTTSGKVLVLVNTNF